MEAKKITIGGTEYTLDKFKGYKAFAIGEVVADIMDAVPDLLSKLSDFNREFAVQNATHVTRGMTALPQFRRIFEQLAMDDAAWEQVGGTVTLPSAASDEAVIAAMFPYVFRQARGHVVRLFAYLLAANAELAKADDGDSVDDLIAEKRKTLMHEADLDELLALALLSVEVVREQFSGKVQALKEAGTTLLTGKQESAPQPTSAEPTAEDAPTVPSGTVQS